MVEVEQANREPGVHGRTAPRRRRTNWRALGMRVIRLAIIVAACFFALFPIYWAVATSFKSSVDIGAMPPKWFFTPVLDNYRTMMFDWDMPTFLRSSLILATISTALCVLVGTLAAFSLSRFHFVAKDAIALDILSIRMVPPIVTAVPVFLLAQRYGLYNSYGLVIALYILFNLPLVIWVMKSFIDDIPRDLDDAAQVDGCNSFQTFLHVILPLATPGLACVTILTFIFIWNEFVFANVLLGGAHRTLPVVAALGLLPRAVLWGPASATAVTIILPVVVLTFFVQQWIVRGLSFGAIR